MTREEEIDAMARRYADNILEITEFCKEDMYSAYVVGAMWADEHHNLESLWHDATEIPTKEARILYRTSLGRYDVIFLSGNKEGIWKVFVKDYGVAEWAYINELRPKGGEK